MSATDYKNVSLAKYSFYGKYFIYISVAGLYNILVNKTKLLHNIFLVMFVNISNHAIKNIIPNYFLDVGQPIKLLF